MRAEELSYNQLLHIDRWSVNLLNFFKDFNDEYIFNQISITPVALVLALGINLIHHPLLLLIKTHYTITYNLTKKS